MIIPTVGVTPSELLAAIEDGMIIGLIYQLDDDEHYRRIALLLCEPPSDAVLEALEVATCAVRHAVNETEPEHPPMKES